MHIRVYPLKLYIRSLPVLIMVVLTACMNLFSWVWLMIHIPRTADQVFLHYNILFGVDKIGNSTQLLYVPLLGLIIFFINVFLGWLLYKKDKFMAYMLNAMHVLCHVFIVIATVLLVFLNI